MREEDAADNEDVANAPSQRTQGNNGMSVQSLPSSAQNASPPKLHSVPIQSPPNRSASADDEEKLLRETMFAYDREDVQSSLHRTQGYSLIAIQNRPTVSQEAPPHSSHSLPVQENCSASEDAEDDREEMAGVTSEDNEDDVGGEAEEEAGGGAAEEASLKISLAAEEVILPQISRLRRAKRANCFFPRKLPR